MNYTAILQQYYLAYFGRAADLGGLNQWLGLINAQDTEAGRMQVLDIIRASFGSPEQPEFVAVYGADVSDSDFFDTAYRNILNRDSDPEGREFWLETLEAQTAAYLNLGETPADASAKARADVLSLVVNAALDQPVGSPDRDTVTTKTATALFITAQTEGLSAEDATAVLVATQALLADPIINTRTAAELQAAVEAIVNEVAPPGFNTFTLTDVTSDSPPGPELLWEGMDASIVLGFFTELAGIEFAGLNMSTLRWIEIQQGENGDIDFDDNNVNITITNTYGESITTTSDADIAYLNFLRDLIFDEDGNPRISVVEPPEEDLPPNLEGVPGIVLTPTHRSPDGVIESGFTTSANDLIVAGQPNLLHGAYIDGGGGYNIIEVDMKGVFAQPYQLLNIQEISVQNLPNVYSDLMLDGLNVSGDVTNSALDLSRAPQLERLVITEGTGFGIGPELGELTIVGIRNGATARLDGGFTEDVYLHYGRGIGSSLTVELNLGDTSSGFNLHVAQNSNTLNLVSLGSENQLISSYLGGSVRELNISGDAFLYIEEPLSGFNANRPATIDASANTAGVQLTIGTPDSIGEGKGGINAMIIMDVSGSMFGQPLMEAQQAAKDALDALAAAGQTMVRLVTFDSTAQSEGDAWMTVAEAKVAIDAWIADGGTDFWAGLQEAQSAWADSGKIAGGANFIYAFGDGDVNVGLTEQAQWEQFLTANGIVSYGIGIGTGISVQALEPIAFNGVTGQQIPPVAGDDFADLLDDIIVESIESITTEGEGHEDVRFTGSSGNDVFTVNNGKNIVIDTGAGTDDVLILNDVDAMAGSSITGENLTVKTDGVGKVDLTLANLGNIAAFVINKGSPLYLTQQQFAALGADVFAAAHGQSNVELHVVINQNTTLADLAELTDLSGKVKLHLEVKQGVTLTLTAEELHKYVGEDGIHGQGKLIITNAGFNFDPDAQSAYGDGGTIGEDFELGVNLTIIRSPNGFDRPGQDGVVDILTIDSDVTPVVEGAISSPFITTLEMVGTADLTFEQSVSLGPNFTIDFSELEGALTGLTVEDFQNVKEMIGNGTDDARVNVVMGDNEEPGIPSTVDPLVTSGVAQYVVVGIQDPDQAVIRLSDVSEDVEVLGLQGNGGRAVAFTNVPFGAVSPTFLMEGDGLADWSETFKATGDPNLSNIGLLVVSFFNAGAPAVVNINNQGTPLGVTSSGGSRPLAVDGIILENAASVEVNVADGNAVIGNLRAQDASSVTLTGEASVALWLDGNSGAGDWESIDASGVAGTAVIGVGEFNDGFAPADFNGDGIAIDFSDMTLTDVDAIVLAKDAEVTLNLTQFGEIALVAGFDPNAHSATVNLADLADEEFSVGLLPDGIELGTVTIAELEEVTLNENTDLTGVIELVVLEGTTLNLTLEQYQQLSGTEAGRKITGDGTVNITDVTQAALEAPEWPDFAAGIDAAFGTLTLADDADEIIFGELVPGAENPAVDLGGFAIVLGENQAITFVNPAQAHERTVTGDGATSSVAFAFGYNAVSVLDTATGLPVYWVDFNGDEVQDSNEGPALNLSGYTDIAELIVWNTLVQGENVEKILGLLTDQSIVVITDPPEGFEVTERTIVVEPGVVVGTKLVGGDAISLILEDLRPEWEVTTLDLILQGGSVIQGILDLTGSVGISDGFQTLTIVSEGDEPNEMNDIRATDNNLLNVAVNAEQDLSLGTILFSSVDAGAEANFTLTGDADVTLKAFDVTDPDVVTLNVANDGVGTLTVTGGSPAVVTDTDPMQPVLLQASVMGGTESLVFSGTGDMVFDTDAASSGTIDSETLSLIDASELTGDLTLGRIINVDSQDFSFISGSGVTTLELTGVTLELDADPDATTPAEPGWSFDFSSAAADSVFEIGAGTWTQGALNIDLGANTTLRITEDADWSGLDLSITQTLPIVLAEGVTLTLTAEQANGLVIVPEAGLDPDTDDMPVVNIINLNTKLTDLRDIDEEIAGVATLAENDVTLHEDTDLGFFGIELQALGDEFGDGQTIRFQNVEQAARAVTVVQPDPHTPVGTLGTNVVWLFNDPADIPAGGVDTSGYSGAIGRLWLNDQLVDGQNVEALFTFLPDSILRVEYTGEFDFGTIGFERTVEIVAFTQLPDGLSFSDEDDRYFVENLTIDLGGQVDLGDLALNNVIGPDIVGTAVFDTLTINSFLATAEGSRLMPEAWEVGNTPPAGPNVIGNISGGAVHSLLNVELNAGPGETGASANALEIESITFSGEGTADLPMLTIGGDEGVTIDNLVLTDPNLSVDTELTFNIEGTGPLTITDAIEMNAALPDSTAVINTNLVEDATVKGIDLGANIVGYTINNNGAGALTVTGGSPALTGENLESLEVYANGDVTIGGEDEEDADNFWGIVAPNLSELTTEGGGTYGSVIIYLDAINGEDFTFTHGAGAGSQVWLDDVELDAGGTWTFNLNGATLGVTGNASLGNGGTAITNGGGTVLYTGDVDLTALDLEINGNLDLIIAENSSLTLTTDQFGDLVGNINSLTKQGDDDEAGILRLVGEGDLRDLGGLFGFVDELELTGETTLTQAQFEALSEFDPDTGDITAVNIVKGTNTLRVDLTNADLLDDPLFAANVDVVLLSVATYGAIDPAALADFDYIIRDTWAIIQGLDPAAAPLDEALGWEISNYADEVEPMLGNLLQGVLWTQALNFDAEDEDTVFDWSSAAAEIFDGDNFEDDAEGVLALARDIEVTDPLEAIQGQKFVGIDNSGDKTYVIEDAASEISPLVGLNATLFAEATSITHTGVGTTATARGTAEVPDTFEWANPITAATSVRNFEVLDSEDNALDELDFTAIDVFNGTALKFFDSVGTEEEIISGFTIIVFTAGEAAGTSGVEAAFAAVTGDFVTTGSAARNDDFGAGGNLQLLFLIADGDGNANIWYWNDADGDNDGDVQAGELTLAGALVGVDLVGLADLTVDNFTGAFG